MTNAEARFNKIHIRKVYACLAVTCHLHFWAEWLGFFTCYCGNTGGGTDTEIRVSTESRPWRRKFYRRSSRDSNPRPFNHESGALTTELSPPPMHPSPTAYLYSLPLSQLLHPTHPPLLLLSPRAANTPCNYCKKLYVRILRRWRWTLLKLKERNWWE